MPPTKYLNSRWLCEILELCQDPQYQDVTLICQDGKLSVNSFLLAAVLPLFGEVKQCSEILFPDYFTCELTDFFNCLYQKSTLVKVPTCFYNFKAVLEEDDPNISNKVKVNDFIKEEEEDEINQIGELFDDIDESAILNSLQNESSENIVKIPIKGIQNNTSDIFRKYENKTLAVPQLKACNLCEKTFSRSNDLMRHKRIKHNNENSEKYVCSECGFTTVYKHALNLHMNSKHWDQDHEKCKKCLKIVPIREPHACEEFSCEKCGKVYYYIYALKRHIKDSHNEQECKQCGQILKSEELLWKHMSEVHQMCEYSFDCNVCNRKFPSQNKLKCHMKFHGKKEECPICKKKVRSIANHKQIMHKSDEEKKFQCNLCGKGFSDPRSLKKHNMNVHLKLRPYECRYGCEFRYNDVSNRNQHERKKHGKVYQ